MSFSKCRLASNLHISRAEEVWEHCNTVWVLHYSLFHLEKTPFAKRSPFTVGLEMQGLHCLFQGCNFHLRKVSVSGCIFFYFWNKKHTLVSLNSLNSYTETSSRTAAGHRAPPSRTGYPSYISPSWNDTILRKKHTVRKKHTMQHTKTNNNNKNSKPGPHLFMVLLKQNVCMEESCHCIIHEKSRHYRG